MDSPPQPRLNNNRFDCSTIIQWSTLVIQHSCYICYVLYFSENIFPAIIADFSFLFQCFNPPIDIIFLMYNPCPPPLKGLSQYLVPGDYSRDLLVDIYQI